MWKEEREHREFRKNYSLYCRIVGKLEDCLVEKELRDMCGIVKIEIMKPRWWHRVKQYRLIIHTQRPGILIGRYGSTMDDIIKAVNTNGLVVKVEFRESPAIWVRQYGF